MFVCEFYIRDYSVLRTSFYTVSERHHLFDTCSVATFPAFESDRSQPRIALQQSYGVPTIR